MKTTKVKYIDIQRHGSYHVYENLGDVSITCPECNHCKFGAGFKIRSSVSNVFVLECYRCGCIFSIEIEKQSAV